jgi:uncharacterized protein (DUF1800 family)
MIPQADDAWTREEAAHLMNRAGFGVGIALLPEWHALGRKKAIEQLLTKLDEPNAEPLPEWATIEKLVEERRERFFAFRDLKKNAPNASEEELDRLRRKAIQEAQQEERKNGLEAQGWWLRRMLSSPNPLHEKMTFFWHDHFATSMQKVKEPTLLVLQNQLFRENALGNFKSLTHAISKDTAMTLYLDTQTSRKGKPNENFARELMELFTLGQGNYTEEDIRESARSFTGYTLDRRTGTITHDRRLWDDGEKRFLGKTGNFDGDGIIDVIFQQSQAAQYLPMKLWEFFAFEKPPQAAVEALGKTFAEGKFEIKPLLREIFGSKAFFVPDCMANQIKCPIQFLIQSVKQLETSMVPPAYALYVQSQLGQILFAPPNVAGWDWGKAWINTNTLLTRYQISGYLCKGSKAPVPEPSMAKGKGFSPEKIQRAMGALWSGPNYDKLVPRELRNDVPAMVDSLIDRLFQRKLADKVRESFIAYANEKKGVIFTNQEVAELVHLMMSTPHYQLC